MRRTGRLLAMLLAAALAGAVGCSEQSRVAPDATVTVAGHVRSADGGAAAGRPVRLGTGITDGEGAFAVLTLGLSCTGGACTGNVRDTTTDDDGRFAFELKGRDTQSSFGEAVSVLVSATGAPGEGEISGPVTSARFRVQATAVELPPLGLVDADLGVEGGDQVTARWGTVPPGPYDLTFQSGADPVWLVRTAEQQASVDPRVLEDTAGSAVVAGASEDAAVGSAVEVRWRSAGVPYAGAAGVPPSRGRTCRFLDAAGRSVVEEGGCGLTDGDLATSAAVPPVCTADGAECGPALAAVVELGAPVPAELVVVRGCQGGCAVEVSADGAAFRPVGAVPDGFGVAVLDGAAVTAVKVSLGETGRGLREVSVWGAPPARALLELDDDDRAELQAPYESGRSGGSRLPVPLVVLAGVAAALALLGAGFTAGRRARRPDRP